MKKHGKRLLSLIMAVALCFGICLPAQAANEKNTLGVTFDVELDTPTIRASSEDQTVVMRLKASAPVAVDGIGFTVTKDDPITIAAITGGEKIGAFNSVATNLKNGIAGWSSSDLENVQNVVELAVITYTVPANTPAGTYTVGIEALELTKDYGNTWEDAASATTTLTITNDDGYIAGLTTLSQEVSVEDTVTVNVNVSHSTDTSFAAGEIVLSYDSEKLAFNKTASTLGAATIQNNDGVLKLEDYGADKNLGNGVYVLAFDAITDGEAAVTLASAAFVNKENAVKSDLIAAVLSPASITLTINKQTHSVTLPDIFTGPATVIDGEDYTFSAADSSNYDYSSVSATVDGVPATVIDNGDGTYMVQNVTGALVITGTRTEKSYTVTFEGNAASEITGGAATATYNTDYTFTMPSADGWAYHLDSITIAGTAYTGYSVENSVYTIPGSAITGDIVITVSKSQTIARVTVEGSGAGAAAGYASKANIGESYTLTIVPEAGYTYTVTATMGGSDVEIANNGDNTYTIANVTDNIFFTVDRTVIVTGVSVTKYLDVDGAVMWLVKNNTTLADGKVPTYDENNMFWSEQYKAYCYLVIAPTLTTDDAATNVGITVGKAVSVDYGMDVNMTGKVDASDAQLTYNMYNAVYSEFTADAAMEKFLRADVNADCVINVQDAAAIISNILA